MLQMEVLKIFVFNSHCYDLTDRNVIVVLKYYIMFFVLETPDDQILDI